MFNIVVYDIGHLTIQRTYFFTIVKVAVKRQSINQVVDKIRTLERSMGDVSI